MALNNPFKQKKDLIFHVTNEIFLFIFYTLILFQELGFFRLDAKLASLIYTRIVYSVLAFNISFNLIDSCRQIVLKIRGRLISTKVINLEIAETGYQLKDQNIR